MPTHIANFEKHAAAVKCQAGKQAFAAAVKNYRVIKDAPLGEAEARAINFFANVLANLINSPNGRRNLRRLARQALPEQVFKLVITPDTLSPLQNHIQFTIPAKPGQSCSAKRVKILKAIQRLPIIIRYQICNVRVTEKQTN